MTHEYSEDNLVEQPVIKLFESLGWDTINAYEEAYGANGTLGRENSSEVILRPRLHTALERLNPELPGHALALAIEELMRDRSVMSPENANRQVYLLIKDGVNVRYQRDGEEVNEKVRVIDWDNPVNNDYLLVSQFWVMGSYISDALTWWGLSTAYRWC